jgi:hypothetical protein
VKAASSSEGSDEYRVLRHLFSEAVESSVGDRRWIFFGSNTEPEHRVVTEYMHEHTRDRIKCESDDYEDGKYRRHLFTYRQGTEP